ncbi:hypothetical protein BJ742DRAFT_738197 [Cladochytrium replicatum]|nr:hypothetical protein BJ742DRAFT_738197 [Cladochytrium replicatum]
MIWHAILWLAFLGMTFVHSERKSSRASASICAEVLLREVRAKNLRLSCNSDARMRVTVLKRREKSLYIEALNARKRLAISRRDEKKKTKAFKVLANASKRSDDGNSATLALILNMEAKFSERLQEVTSVYAVPCAQEEFN